MDNLFPLDLLTIPGITDAKQTEEEAKKTENQTVTTAQKYGIDISKYCTFDENGKIKSIDIDALNLAIQVEEAKENLKTSNESQNDQFCKSGDDQKLTNEEVEEADDCQAEIDAEYDAALKAYAASLDASTQNDQLAAQMAAIQAEANDYIGVNVTSTTVIEGGQDFISRVQTVTNDAKNTSNDKAGEIAEDPTGDAALEANPIITDSTEDGTNPFGNPFYQSAMETFADEDDEAIAA